MFVNNNLLQIFKEKKNIVISICFLLFIIAFAVFYIFSNKNHQDNEVTVSNSLYEDSLEGENNSIEEEKRIFVDISGEVRNKGVYEMKKGDRVKDVIEKAGGLTERADQSYIDKNLNQAALLSDGQKVFIPSLNEGNSLGEISGVIDGKISINSASRSELDGLSGIGEKRASSIISGRPYDTIDDLVSRKIIPQSVFEEIKDEICL